MFIAVMLLQTGTTNYCGGSPCKNNGTCSNGQYSYTCQCQTGWTGKNCDTSKNILDITIQTLFSLKANIWNRFVIEAVKVHASNL